MSTHRRIAAFCVLLSLSIPGLALAQRELHWQRLEVDARLDAAGHLEVAETQTIVFTGDWNGGERKINLRPHQQLSAVRMSRAYGGELRELTEDHRLLKVDDFSRTDPRTVRWRSRLPADPPFARTPITYVLRYRLSGTLVKDGDRYLLDHDFAFPDRTGTIDNFVLRLTLDPAWQPLSEVRTVYTASGLAVGKSFVVTVPMHYTGAGQPVAREGPNLRAIAIAVSIVLGVTALAVLAFFAREQAYGRFEPVTTDQIDEAWISKHILKYPAEVVGAAWDDGIGPPEVVALIARMVGEGKLESQVASESAQKASMTLRLKADRSTFEGHERTLVEALFFDGRSETSTEEVRAHYSGQGFDPAKAITSELETRVRAALEAGDRPRLIGWVGVIWFLACAGLLWMVWYRGDAGTAVVLFIGVAALVVAGVARGAGVIFRSRMDWGRRAALLCLLPALTVAAATASFLGSFAAKDAVELPPLMMVAVIALSLWMTYTSISGMKSRPSRAAVAIRKKLTAGREFFRAELSQPKPALRDEWYPWVLAFGLGKQADAWSTQRAPTTVPDRPRLPRERHTSSPSSDGWTGSSAGDGWSGFGGGRSGGGGGGAAWSVAAAGMVAPVAAPRSSHSSSGSDRSSSDGGSSGGSSSGGSSGGGGGGGW